MSLNHKTISELRNVEQHFSLKADHVGIVFMLQLQRDLFQSYMFSSYIHQVASILSGGELTNS